jgi:hypothetical protein
MPRLWPWRSFFPILTCSRNLLHSPKAFIKPLLLKRTRAPASSGSSSGCSCRRAYWHSCRQSPPPPCLGPRRGCTLPPSLCSPRQCPCLCRRGQAQSWRALAVPPPDTLAQGLEVGRDALSAKLPASEGCVLACTYDEARPPSEAWSCAETRAARSDTCARRLCRRGCPTVVDEAASEKGAAGTLASLAHPSLPSHRPLLQDASDAEVYLHQPTSLSALSCCARVRETCQPGLCNCLDIVFETWGPGSLTGAQTAPYSGPFACCARNCEPALSLLLLVLCNASNPIMACALSLACASDNRGRLAALLEEKETRASKQSYKIR